MLQERPAHLQPRVLLLRNLMRQSEGREADVPALALQALQEAGETWPAYLLPLVWLDTVFAAAVVPVTYVLPQQLCQYWKCCNCLEGW